MRNDIKPRKSEKKIDYLFEIFQAVAVTGPRQSGKSTLIKEYIKKSKENWNYISFDDREKLLQVKEDPSLFIESIETNTVIDEAQKAPEIFHLIKKMIDDGCLYKFILSGSANFLLLKSITESLAGRIGLIELLPYSISEAFSLKSNNFIKTIISSKNIKDLYKKFSALSKNQLANNSLLNFILYGGFPMRVNLV